MAGSRYTPIRKLASGGMGDIHLARQHTEGGVERLVALKRLRSELIGDQSFPEMFRNEARVAARMSHPNIVQVFDFGELDGALFLAMEYVDGRTLQHVLARAWRDRYRLPFAAIAALAIPLARALDYAHELRGEEGTPLGIVHRDLSPSNVIISFEGAPKILDFGIAKASIAVDATEQRSLKGKLTYLSPEQLRLEPVDRRADLYALGILLWELTTGRKLYDVTSWTDAAQVIGTAAIPSIAELRPDAPPGWEGLLRKALASGRDDRFATARELQLELEGVARFAGFVGSNLSVVRMMADLFPEAALAAAPPPAAAPRRPLVLAVDDEPEIREMIRRALRKHFEVRLAGSVVEAIAALAADPFDAVLTDERMPGGRGLDLLVHAAQASPRTVRVMATAFADPELMLRAINEGSVHRFMLKPLQPDALVAILKEALAEHAWKGDSTGAPVAVIQGEETGVGGPARVSEGDAFGEQHPQTEIDPSRGTSAPAFVVPWDRLREEAAPARETALSAAVLVAVSAHPLTDEQSWGVARLVGERLDRSFLHAEENVVVVIAPGILLGAAQDLAAELRRLLLEGERTLPGAAVGIALAPHDADLVEIGAVAEGDVRLAWLKETEHVLG